jgi:hypothetical protein
MPSTYLQHCLVVIHHVSELQIGSRAKGVPFLYVLERSFVVAELKLAEPQ